MIVALFYPTFGQPKAEGIGHTGMLCRLQDCDAIIFQHMQQCCLASIVETEEEDFGVLVEETERCKGIPAARGHVSVTTDKYKQSAQTYNH